MCRHHVTEIKGEQLVCKQCGEILVDVASERENGPDVEHLQRENEIHWSERKKYGYIPQTRKEWELGDKMADGSDLQGWDIEPNEPLEMED